MPHTHAPMMYLSNKPNRNEHYTIVFQSNMGSNTVTVNPERNDDEAIFQFLVVYSYLQIL